MKHKENQTRK